MSSTDGLSRRTGGPPLSRDAVLAAALEVGDAGGLESVSMRTLAGRFACTPRALYRYIGDKDSMLEAVVGQQVSALPTIPPDEPWQPAMERFFVAFHDLLLAHPLVAQVMARRPIAGPEVMRHAERALTVLVAAGMSDELAVEAFVALAYYTLGASTGGTGQVLHDEWRSRGDQIEPAEFPTLARLGRHLAEALGEERFRRGLGALIETFERRMAGRQRP
ncbi:MAG TPA: TetR/AcrR family transcriptional regulator C-terminal domain-containing protein [Pseudonocardia sp.]|nr:TetR/AcrR family transcriptional regulator C-terminal domain-containing protein [Pseudonocardia sp.]